MSSLGAKVESFIPSRQDQGYGLNLKMINEINSKNIRLIVTVDNGISAFDAIKRSNDLGIDLIITDHHKIPTIKYKYHSLLHPERTPINSPYKYLAGVGIAYILIRHFSLRRVYSLSQLRNLSRFLSCYEIKYKQLKQMVESPDKAAIGQSFFSQTMGIGKLGCIIDLSKKRQNNSIASEFSKTIAILLATDNSKIENEVKKEIIDLCSSFPIYGN